MTLNPLTPEETAKMRANLWLEQYKMQTAGIAARVDLQQRNANVHVVLIAAIVSLVATYWSRTNYLAVVDTEFAVLLVIAPAISFFFIWRHIDHDFNIVDYAGYVNSIIAPALAELNGEDTLVFEHYLRNRRWSRARSTALISVLANDAVIIFVTAMPFLAISWAVRFTEADRAGSAKLSYDVILYVDTAFAAITIFLMVSAAIKYGSIGRSDNVSPAVIIELEGVHEAAIAQNGAGNEEPGEPGEASSRISRFSRTERYVRLVRAVLIRMPRISWPRWRDDRD